MSQLIVDLGKGPVDGQELAKPIIDRIRQGLEHRKGFEPTWHSNLAFASGKHHLEWHRFQRALVMPDELKDKELYTADVIGEYRGTALGELGSDDDRPELLLRRDDGPSESFAETLNRALGFGWDAEWSGDEVLDEVDQLVVDLGTAAVRARFDPNYGPVVNEVPHMDGQPVHDPQQQAALFQNGPNPAVTMQPVRQGRIVWEALSPFNLIVPPGSPREKTFAWECVVRPVLLASVQDEYGAAAKDLREDGDIGSVYGWTADSGGGDYGAPGGSYGTAGGNKGRLRDHVWLYTYYERPTKMFPNGRTAILAGSRMTPLKFDNTLPVCGPDGEYRSGLAYFHWWRVTGRFWSRSLIDPMKDIQRRVNKRRTQDNEIIDRSMPFLIVQSASKALDRTGAPVEMIEVEGSERPPMYVQSTGPGSWMQADIEAAREDLEHATGIKAVRLGENPGSVNTYSQLALINENDQAKREKILSARKTAIKTLVEDSVHYMRTYWGPQREITLAGDEDEADAATFNATEIPAFFIVKVAKGATRPRSQAAELQKVQDIWNAAVAAATVTHDPDGWVRWYKESLDAGQCLDLPSLPTDDQAEKAEMENHFLLKGESVMVDYYDPPQTHVDIHRLAQNQARIAGDMPAYQAIEEHVQMHLAAAKANAAKVAAAMPPPPPTPGAPGQTPPPSAPPAGGPPNG